MGAHVGGKYGSGACLMPAMFVAGFNALPTPWLWLFDDFEIVNGIPHLSASQLSAGPLRCFMSQVPGALLHETVHRHHMLLSASATLCLS